MNKVYSWFDSIIGLENTGILIGKEYIEKNVVINDKHKFFNTSNFIKGTIEYDGQTYSDLDLKYNVANDLLLVQIQKRGGQATFELQKNKIKTFYIDQHYFVNIPVPENSGAAISGFFEVIFENENISLLKKHLKKEKKLLDKNFAYYEYENDDPEYGILYDGKNFPANSSREIIRIFPEEEKMIRKHFRNKSQLKTDPDLFMIDLTKKLI